MNPEFGSRFQAKMVLTTLTALEIVLGIDNIIFVAILAGKLPVAQQARARILKFSAGNVNSHCLATVLSVNDEIDHPIIYGVASPTTLTGLTR